MTTEINLDDYSVLTQWATVRQLEILEALREHGTQRKAAKALGVSKNTVCSAVERLRMKAQTKAYSPEHEMHHPLPDAFIAAGVSLNYVDGKLKQTWVKGRLDEQRAVELTREVIKALVDDVKNLAPLSKPPHKTIADLAVVYPMGDPHFGLYSWAKETGENFDLAEAKRLTLSAVDRLLQAAPPAAVGIVLPLGDVFHANDQSNQTPAHKHQLDVDGRFVKVLEVGIQTYRHVIQRALEKHDRVIVRFVQGNHDPQAVWGLAFAISAFFASDPRVDVDLSPSKFWFLRWGKVLLGATHGDTVKANQLLGVMACDRAEDWGETTHRYWYTGHVHHQRVVEFPGVVCETFRTLAARDAYAAGHGYRAGRDMRAIVLHKEHGEIERYRCDIGMIAAQ